MPKYLFLGSYTEQGVKGLLKDGGSKRRDLVDQVTRGLGGRLETFYYALGDDDFVVIVDLPSHADATAMSLAVNGSGAVKLRTTMLLTPEEVDESTRKSVAYRPPGQ